MTRICFLFPGQGSQLPGMGKDFAESFSAAREVFEHADEVLGRKLSTMMFEGPAELLTETGNSQPAILVMSLALLAVLKEQMPDLRPSFCAGHSLGEYSALVAAGVLTSEDSLRLVAHRSAAMNAACEATQGGMAAVIGLDGEQVKAIVDELRLPNDLWAANFNSPGQTVISGTAKGLELAAALLKEKGARRVLPLQVHGAFHSPLMREAEASLADQIEGTPFTKPHAAIAMNVSGALSDDPGEIKALLRKQVTQPVLWEQSIRAIDTQAPDLYVEVGCGKVLTGLNKKIGVAASTINIDKVAGLETLAERR
jgi:[acyl-carrier-protein] S-malonyltransferase